MGLKATSGAGPGHVIHGDSESSSVLGEGRRLRRGDKKQVRVSSQEVVTERMAAEVSLKEIVQGLAASQKVLTENVVLEQATINQLMKQQGELLQAIAPTPL